MRTLPTFEECARNVDACVATKLEVFIYENEPAHPEMAAKFRETLQDLIAPMYALIQHLPHGAPVDKQLMDDCAAVFDEPGIIIGRVECATVTNLSDYKKAN